jgi:DNA polymerase-4
MRNGIRWLFLDLNSFFASCEQQERPELRGKPVGVVPLLAETTCCLAASYEAKAHGVKTGTLVREARVRCPDIQFVLARHDVYTRYHYAVVEAVESCLPVDAVMSIDEMICSLSGSQRELPKALELAARIKEKIRKDVGVCLTSSIGIAPNRFLAKLASDMKKPDGLTVLQPEQLPDILYPLALRDLSGIGGQMEIRLNEQGIHTMRELCELTREEMHTIWGGVSGDRYYQWLRGEDVELPPTQHRSLGHQHVLEPEMRTRDGVWTVAKKLLAKAAVRLRKEGFYTRCITAQIKFTGHLYWEEHIRFEPTQDTLKLLTALRGMWPTVKREIPFRVGVTFSDLVSRERYQFPLFENPHREDLGPAMDKINAKFGKETISLGSLYQFQQAAPTRIAFRRIPTLDEFED